MIRYLNASDVVQKLNRMLIRHYKPTESNSTMSAYYTAHTLNDWLNTHGYQEIMYRPDLENRFQILTEKGVKAKLGRSVQCSKRFHTTAHLIIFGFMKAQYDGQESTSSKD